MGVSIIFDLDDPPAPSLPPTFHILTNTQRTHTHNWIGMSAFLVQMQHLDRKDRAHPPVVAVAPAAVHSVKRIKTQKPAIAVGPCPKCNSNDTCSAGSGKGRPRGRCKSCRGTFFWNPPKTDDSIIACTLCQQQFTSLQSLKYHTSHKVCQKEKNTTKHTKLHALNTTGYRGVYKNKNGKKYQAQIKVDGKTIHLGTFWIQSFFQYLTANKYVCSNHWDILTILLF